MSDDDNDFELPEHPPIGFEAIVEKFCDLMEPHADKLGEGAQETFAMMRATLRKTAELDVEAHALRQKIARLEGLPPEPQN